VTQRRDKLARQILLKLYECSANHGAANWFFESAFRALHLECEQSVIQSVQEYMVGRGWLVLQGGFSHMRMVDGGERHSINQDTGVTLTPRGKDAAIRFLEDCEPKTIIEQLHALHWATWGGLAAIVAAIASVAAAYFSYLAVDR
jgi:hypothetical protein